MCDLILCLATVFGHKPGVLTSLTDGTALIRLILRVHTLCQRASWHWTQHFSTGLTTAFLTWRHLGSGRCAFYKTQTHVWLTVITLNVCLTALGSSILQNFIGKQIFPFRDILYEWWNNCKSTIKRNRENLSAVYVLNGKWKKDVSNFFALWEDLYNCLFNEAFWVWKYTK